MRNATAQPAPLSHPNSRASAFRGPRRGAAVALALVALGCGIPGDGAPRQAAGGEGAAADPALDTGTTVFLHVNVVPMDRKRILEDQTVVVRDGRIVALRPASELQAPEAKRTVEGTGRYLIPGLGEMHAHIPRGAREEMERVLFLFLARGITTVRGMLGAPEHLELRDAVARGEVLGPRIYTSGPSLNGNSIPDPDSARRAVLHQRAAGYDFLKIHPGLSRAAYDAIARTARSVGIRWAGHVPAEVGLPRALEAGQATIDHLDGYMEALVPAGAPEIGLEPLFFGVHLVDAVDEARIPAVAADTREAGVWNVPTQSLIEHVLSPELSPEELARRPEMRLVPPRTVEGWVEAKRRVMTSPSYTPDRARRFIAIRRKIIRALRDAGADLLLGSDAPQIFQVPGVSAHEELRLLVASGVTPYEALEAATRNVARYFGALDRFGTVEEGKVADLVLLEANPLEEIDHVARQAGVMVRGRWFPAAEIRERLEAMARSYREE